MPRRHVAEAVLGMPATSAATERTFSSYGFIHSKTRNHLTTKRAGMLTYIHHNLKLFSHKSVKPSKDISFGLGLVDKERHVRHVYSRIEQNRLETIPDADEEPSGASKSPLPSTSTSKTLLDNGNEHVSCTSDQEGSTTDKSISLIEELEGILSKS
ncbi:uncharacterized protein LOC126743113 [Anthonomus grandis grandis]|uniref:uncharacterized protein LOC126743113 n=1 Tax=Anthonomus grandis grandis TaxID=2921223 RepID=UPI0021652EDF|nr:uncharacterized protein LOC126743113 [Anthonomus grandis grandis]